MAKVTDFGIAKAVSNSTITAFGTTMGSVHYFSPEHARGGITDAKSDLYSLGVVMYEMLTGKVPFDADTPVSVALKHIQEKPVEPKVVNPSIPKAVNDIVMKAMQKEPSLRYQNAGEMLRDLSMSLKDPDGDFVKNGISTNDFATQVISTVYTKNNAEDTKKENENKTDNKKKSGFAVFVKNHKVLVGIISMIILFALAFGGTSAIIELTTPKDVVMPNLVGMDKEEAKKRSLF